MRQRQLLSPRGRRQQEADAGVYVHAVEKVLSQSQQGQVAGGDVQE